jgi:hypothetical protein
MDSGSERTSTPRSESFWLVAYFLSRCTAAGNRPPVQLGVGSWKEAYDRFYDSCGQGRDVARFRNSLRGTRDTFDSHLPNSRRGFLAADHKTPRPLGSIATAILATWRERTDAELFAVIEELLAGPASLAAAEQQPSALERPESVRVSRGAVLRRSRSTPLAEGREGRVAVRRSVEAKRVGDRAEQIVRAELLRTLPPAAAETLVHHAAIGETPGYDLSYSRDGDLFAVEVKGTVSASMDTFEITAGEVLASRRLGSRYHLYLVASVDSSSPNLQVIEGLGNEFDLTPTRFVARLRSE